MAALSVQDRPIIAAGARNDGALVTAPLVTSEWTLREIAVSRCGRAAAEIESTSFMTVTTSGDASPAAFQPKSPEPCADRHRVEKTPQHLRPAGIVVQAR